MSGTKRCKAAIEAGRHTVPEIAVHAHVSQTDAQTYLKRLKDRGIVEKIPARWILRNAK